MIFWKEFFRLPHVTGAIAPSSKHLAKVMVEQADVRNADRVIELGPGTGVFTESILEAKRPDARFVAVEFNENFVQDLKGRFPEAAFVQGCASKLRDHASNHEVEEACSIVSGLPWAIFDNDMQKRILHEIREVLGEKGVFATFAYWGPHWLPSGQHFRQLLKKEFGSVRMSPVVMRNFPPAFVYVCAK